jgi:hypothetical protein
MITVRKSQDRGHFNHGWLDTYHTFSFGRYIDREHMGFRALRVINEDVVAPYVLSGTLTHGDSLGHSEPLRHGELQRMSAGTGIEHSEVNGSRTDPVRLLQIWLLPARQNTAPAYGQQKFPIVEQPNRLHLLASPDGANGSLTIGQDARLYSGILDKSASVNVELKPGRHAWVQVAHGSVTVNGQTLAAGDGAAVSNESSLTIAAAEKSELLVFDLN